MNEREDDRNLRRSRCRTCQAPIVWALTELGERMPVDAEPVADGTMIFFKRIFPASKASPIVHVTTQEERTLLEIEALRAGVELRLFVSHFATCPQADEHRGRRASEEVIG